MKTIYKWFVLILVAMMISSCSSFGKAGEETGKTASPEDFQKEEATPTETRPILRLAPGIFPGKIHFGIQK